MNRCKDGGCFPAVGKDKVFEWVDEIGFARTAGERVLLVITSNRRCTPPAASCDLGALRLSYAQRAADLLCGRPESATILARIHRIFDEFACSEEILPHRLGALGADVLAHILAALAEARGVRIRIERRPQRGTKPSRSPSSEEETLIRLVAW